VGPAWDLGYAVAMAIACLISYAVITELLGIPFEGHRDPIAGIWAAVSTAFVFRDTRQRSLSARVRPSHRNVR
jgi:hypothetical protein